MQLRSNDTKYGDKETTINDFNEMVRRIKLFTTTWDRILWIDKYIETNNGKMPKKETISEELGVSMDVASYCLDCHEQKEIKIDKNLDELLMDFNVYDDCILWWCIIIHILKTRSSLSLWLIFEKVAESYVKFVAFLPSLLFVIQSFFIFSLLNIVTPGNCAIQLLSEFELDLTRFDAEKLHAVAQNIVIGSQYPVCASLRIAKWFNDRASYDVARGIFFFCILFQ